MNRSGQLKHVLTDYTLMTGKGFCYSHRYLLLGKQTAH